MRSPTEVLKHLNEKSQDKGYRFQRLYRNLYNPEFYYAAYRNNYANGGSMTPGVDGTTVDGLGGRRIGQIIESLREESYQPQPARREYIEKKNSTKKRPLGIPSGGDKLVQEIVRMLLESIYDSTFSNRSHGFRQHKSCHTALKQIQDTFTGATWFVEGDITACFDSFDHHVLIDLMKHSTARVVRPVWEGARPWPLFIHIRAWSNLPYDHRFLRSQGCARCNFRLFYRDKQSGCFIILCAAFTDNVPTTMVRKR